MSTSVRTQRSHGGEGEGGNVDRGSSIARVLALLPCLRTRSGEAALFGYSAITLRTLKWRGRPIPPHRVELAASALERVALQLRAMARATPEPVIVRPIRAEVYLDLGLALGDAEGEGVTSRRGQARRG